MRGSPSLFARTLLVCAVLSAGCGGGAGSGTPGEPRDGRAYARNVLLLVADTLRADRLGCYGYERDTSPAIDRLAAEGTLYESCHSQACWTVPSMISLMSGLAVTRKETQLPTLPVLSEALQAQGLTTAAFLANSAVGVDRGFERGFDHFEECSECRADEVAAAFERWYRPWTERASDGARFFAWVHFVDPHHPYEPLADHDSFDGPRPGLEILATRWSAAEAELAELDAGPSLSVAEASERMNSASNRYDGEVRAVDAGVDRVLGLLEETGQRDETLVVFCSDHGEMLYEQPNFPYLVQQRREELGGLPEGVMELFGAGHRPWYYEDLWRTPLILAGPGVPSGERVGGLAANLDIYPTVLAALGLEIPPHLAGESLLGGREPLRERVFAYGHRTTAVLDSEGRKLIEHWPRSFLLPKGASGPLELYDLRADPGEREDLSVERPELARELLDAVEAWRAAAEREVIDEETEAMRDRLRRLGYLGDDPGEDPDG